MARRNGAHEASIWVDETKVETLRRRWRDGWSAAQIARELSDKPGDVTRSAVIGKARRLGLPSHVNAVVCAPSGKSRLKRYKRVASAARKAASDAARAALQRMRIAKDRPPLPAAHEAPRERNSAPEMEPPLMLDLLALRDRTCRWPIGDPLKDGFGFCGHPSASGSYCAHHAKEAVQPLKPGQPKSGAQLARSLRRYTDPVAA